MLRNHRNLTAAEVARKNGHALVAEVIEADLRLARPNLLLTTLTWGHMTDQTSREFKDARLYPGGAAAWDWGKTGTRHQPGIQWADLEDLMSLQPEIVILSRGVNCVLQVPTDTIEAVQATGTLVLVLQTDEAVAEYNRRAHAGARVVALVHSTC